MQKIKTANIILIIAVVILIVGFVLIITHKQSVNSATCEVKTFWGKPKADTPAEAQLGGLYCMESPAFDGKTPY